MNESSSLTALLAPCCTPFEAKTSSIPHSIADVCTSGHKDKVQCIACSVDGKVFASGGADNMVIIWSASYEGIVKYKHNESIQCLAFNPRTQQLASGATTDFGIWRADQTVVSKNSVSSKVLSMAWNNDGSYLALGHFNGSISIRDINLTEKASKKQNQDVYFMPRL